MEDYVIERAKVSQDKEGYENAGMSKSAFYKWDEEQRTRLNGLAFKLKRENAAQAMLVFQGYAEQAAENIVRLAEKGRSETVRLSANKMIYEQIAGTPTQKIEQNNSGSIEVIQVTVKDD